MTLDLESSAPAGAETFSSQKSDPMRYYDTSLRNLPGADQKPPKEFYETPKIEEAKIGLYTPSQLTEGLTSDEQQNAARALFFLKTREIFQDRAEQYAFDTIDQLEQDPNKPKISTKEYIKSFGFVKAEKYKKIQNQIQEEAFNALEELYFSQDDINLYFEKKEALGDKGDFYENMLQEVIPQIENAKIESREKGASLNSGQGMKLAINLGKELPSLSTEDRYRLLKFAGFESKDIPGILAKLGVTASIHIPTDTLLAATGAAAATWALKVDLLDAMHIHGDKAVLSAIVGSYLAYFAGMVYRAAEDVRSTTNKNVGISTNAIVTASYNMQEQFLDTQKEENFWQKAWRYKEMVAAGIGLSLYDELPYIFSVMANPNLAFGSNLYGAVANAGIGLVNAGVNRYINSRKAKEELNQEVK